MDEDYPPITGLLPAIPEEDLTEEWEWESPVLEAEAWEVQKHLEEMSAAYELRPSDFIEQVIQFPTGKDRKLTAFSFEKRPYLRRVHNTPSDRILLMTGRQVEKSTSLAIKAFVYTCLIPHFRVLYVSPSSTQTKQFSNDRLKELMETCPALRTWFPSRLTDNVFEKKAINRSQVTLRYAFLNADRCRGLSADGIFLDEFQDILLDNIPVIEEASSHSPFRYFVYSGTPKSEDNPIEYYWAKNSTQSEWAVPCERHGTPKDPGSWHWNILDESNIARKGLSCDRCGNLIRPDHPLAQWVRLGPPLGEVQYEGLRIPQLMVPWVAWEDILYKQQHYPRGRFYNEVLGRSFDSGQRPLSRADVQRNCDEELSMAAEKIRELMPELRRRPIFAGIDWGQDSTNSYTILVLGAYLGTDKRMTVFYAHRFEGPEQEPRVQLDKVKKFIKQFSIRRVGVDYGGGHFQNDELMREFGTDRIHRYQYSNPREFVRWDAKLGRYLVHKHEVLGSVFAAIKRGDLFRFPQWSQWKVPFASDMLSVFSEYDEKRRMTAYKKSPNNTDDTLHALVFLFLASYQLNPRPDVLIPSQKIDQDLARQLSRALRGN